MSFSFLQYIKDVLPQAFVSEFERKLLVSSLYNIRLLSWVGFAFFFPLILLDYLRFLSGSWNESPVFGWIAVSHTVLVGLFIPALLANKYLKQIKMGEYDAKITRFTRWFPVIVGLMIYPNFVMSILVRGNIVFYAVFILTINVAILFPHRARLAFNIWFYLMILAAVAVIFYDKAEMILLLFIETTGVSLPAYLIATYQYNLKVREFVTRKALHEATERSESLLLNILPAQVAVELKEKGYYNPRLFSEVTILFADFKDFSIISRELSPEELVSELHACFSHFDGLMADFGLEKIKTIGDAYVCVCGLPTPTQDHARRVVQAGCAMQLFLAERRAANSIAGQIGFHARIGIHSGAVLAGVVGTKKYVYDIWGDSVNIAARCQEAAEVDSVNISEQTWRRLSGGFSCTPRGEIAVKNLGAIAMYKVEI